ncbi:hypothetical protein BCR44DRAFT_1427622 [Catenaria anguillulae PL171]|uniref:Uncharacterized protein n=1 Tax=Catenaria anguillulae PL171 TaxID=765915 RepID=A0A1Y2HXF5_9FUNG|nr:hypothetical protein BCR44DRAFT_1427622 [Catenaria anguillulae PL171]
MMDPFAVDPPAHSPPSKSVHASATTDMSPNRRGSRTVGSITLTYNGARRQSATASNPFNIAGSPTGAGGGGGRRRSRYSDTVWRRLMLWTSVMHRTESWESNETLPLEHQHRIRHAVTNFSQGGAKYLVVTCVAVAALLMVGLFWSSGLSHDIQLLLIVSICVFYFGGMASLCVVDYRSIKHRRHMRHHQVGPQQPGLGGGGNASGPVMSGPTGANSVAVNRRVNTVVP